MTRGFIYAKESEDMIQEIDDLVQNTFEMCMRTGVRDWTTIKTRIKERVSRFVTSKTRRSPMILPVIMEV